MYVQVVTYALGGIDENEYLNIANELAPRFSGLPGLQAKLWLEDPDLGRYGAIYFWEDKEFMERFLRSDLFEGTYPDFEDVDSEGFGILANLTAQTQPGLEVVEPPRRPVAARPAQKAISKKATTPAVSSGGARRIPVASKAAPAEAPAKKAPARKAPGSGKATPAKATAKKVTAKKATLRGSGTGAPQPRYPLRGSSSNERGDSCTRPARPVAATNR